MLHATIIGIDRYADRRIRPLSFASRDAETFGRLLSERIRPEDRHVTVLRDEEATREKIMHAIGGEMARRARPDDIAIIYFAGHGSPERRDPRDEDYPFLIAHDTVYDRIYATGISMVYDVKEWLRLLQVRLAVVFLDACFSGAAGGRTFGGPVHAENRGRHADVPISIKDLELGEGRLIIAAADDHEVALERDSLGHGIFTYHLLEILRQPPAAENTIGIGTLYDKLARGVAGATERRQNPVSHGKSLLGALPLLGERAAGADARATAGTTASP